MILSEESLLIHNKFYKQALVLSSNGVSVVTEHEKKESIHSEEKKQDDEALNIDFAALKHKTMNFFKGLTSAKAEKHEHSKPEEDFSFDISGMKLFWKNNARWLMPLFCILIALTFSVYLRTMPLRMPVADEWATGTVHNFYRGQIEQQINQQYPNLPPQNRQIIIEKDFQSQLQENKELITSQIAQLGQQYRDEFHDDQGTLYLLGLDPYHYYRMVGNVLANGHQGTTLKDGQPWDEYFLYPEGRYAGKDFHAYAGAFVHKLINLFGDYPLMFTFFLLGVIFSGLAVIPAFFIGRRISGNNVGGFFTAFLIAVAAFFVSRTTGESSDTDIYTVFFPLLITWFFIEAYYAKEQKKAIIYILLAGLATGVFSSAWIGGWWYIFLFLIATAILSLLYLLVKHYKEVTTTIKSTFFRNHVVLLLLYLVTSGIFTTLFSSFRDFLGGFMGPLGFIRLKAVAFQSLWPNIRTTIAELNVPPLSAVIDQVGGKLLFAIAVIGILLTLLKREDRQERDVTSFFLLAMWLVASLFATTKGVRFILQAVPVLSIATGVCLGIAWYYGSTWVAHSIKLNKKVAMFIIFLLLSLLLIEPTKAGYQQAYQSVPSMNDQWYNTLHKIDVEGDKKAVINSWWDFGHWFKAIGNRPVTFDGAAQVGYDAYWVGKSLLTPDEKVTTGILHMLDCGQNNAYTELDKVLNDTPREINILNQIITEDKSAAIKTLQKNGLTTEQIAAVIQYTHCDPPTNYFITSEDMVGKAGVWGHFGGWDFDRAEMYFKVNTVGEQDAISILTQDFNLTLEQASQYYAEIQSAEADQWISGWPGYQSGASCRRMEDNVTIECPFNTPQGTAALTINLRSMNASIPTNNGQVYPSSLVFATEQGVEEKKFPDDTIGTSVILLPGNDQIILAHPAQAKSMFTQLFFFDGYGLRCFTKFDDVRQSTGAGRIITWLVDWECAQ